LFYLGGKNVERLDVIFKSIVAGAGAVTGYLYGGWDTLLQVLLIFVIVDYLTGIIAGGTNGKLSSKIGFRGILKKVLIFIIVAVAHWADLAVGVSLGEDVAIFRNATIFFYLANELLSITENAGEMGVPIPEKLMNAVEILKGKSKEE